MISLLKICQCLGRHKFPRTVVKGIVPDSAAKVIDPAFGSKPENNISTHQNVVVLLLVLSYLGAAILVFHFIDDWPVVDCVYYAMVIVTTIGYGDLVPATSAGKAATIFFTFYGICMIGIALGKLASLFLEKQKAITKTGNKAITEKCRQCCRFHRGACYISSVGHETLKNCEA